MKKRKRIKTKKKEIIDYWTNIEDECGLNFDKSEADTICWRCGCERKLQRCHIIPDSLGGKDEPSNFVLLCSECHAEAPNVESPTFMWDWIKSFYSPFYNTFWQDRGMQEYERIYKKSFSEELTQRNITSQHALYTFWNLKTGRTSYHFGHPYGNVSTIAGNYKMLLDAFDSKYPNRKYLSNKKLQEELDFEKLTNSFCELAEKHKFSVWEGGTRNPYSLCMSTFFPSQRKYLGIAIKKKFNTYFMCSCSECNPNHIPTKLFTINIGNNHKEILLQVENALKQLINSNGKHQNKSPYYLVINPYWKRKNKD